MIMMRVLVFIWFVFYFWLVSPDALDREIAKSDWDADGKRIVLCQSTWNLEIYCSKFSLRITCRNRPLHGRLPTGVGLTARCFPTSGESSDRRSFSSFSCRDDSCDSSLPAGIVPFDKRRGRALWRLETKGGWNGSWFSWCCFVFGVVLFSSALCGKIVGNQRVTFRMEFPDWRGFPCSWRR